MPIDAHILAVALMEFFGVASFLLSFMFRRQSQEIGGKMEALKEALKKAPTVSERRWCPCYSYKWVMTRSLRSRSPITRLIGEIGVGAPLVMGIFALSGIITFTVLIIFCSAGYTLFIALIGAAILLGTDAFEAYSYATSIQKISLGQLVEEDQSYMEIAREAFEMGTLRLLIVGTTFAVAGPFVPQIFHGLVYSLTMYTNILFQATETAMNASRLLGAIIALILPGILLYLPELVVRTILHARAHYVPEMRARTEAHKYTGH